MTKKSFSLFQDVNNNICHLEDKVAYAKGHYGSRPEIHIGIVKRITPEGVWILPDEKWKDDASNKVKNMPENMSFDEYYGQHAYDHYTGNRVTIKEGWINKPEGKTQVYNWCYVKYSECLKLC